MLVALYKTGVYSHIRIYKALVVLCHRFVSSTYLVQAKIRPDPEALKVI